MRPERVSQLLFKQDDSFTDQPVILIPPFRVIGRIGAVGNTNFTWGICICSMGAKSAHPLAVSPSPWRRMTVAVCLVLLGKHSGVGYCQLFVCIACTLVWLCAALTCRPPRSADGRLSCDCIADVRRAKDDLVALVANKHTKERWQAARASKSRICLLVIARCCQTRKTVSYLKGCRENRKEEEEEFYKVLVFDSCRTAPSFLHSDLTVSTARITCTSVWYDKNGLPAACS